MIIGVGVDCEEIKRFEKLVNKKGFVSKVLSDREIKIFHKKGVKKAEFLAGRFVAKESIIKALSKTISYIHIFNMKDINIKGIKGGQLQVVFGKRILGEKKISVDVSISHCKSVAMAFCVAQQTGGAGN